MSAVMQGTFSNVSPAVLLPDNAPCMLGVTTLMVQDWVKDNQGHKGPAHTHTLSRGACPNLSLESPPITTKALTHTAALSWQGSERSLQTT